MNLIVICLDTLRADMIPNPDVKTPNMDAFAKESVNFTGAFGESGPTIQMRRSCFTGMRCFPWRYNFDKRGLFPSVYGWHKIPPEQPTISEILLENGYATGLISDTYHMFKSTMNFIRGFTSYEFIRGQESDPYRMGNLEKVDFSKYVPEGDTDRTANRNIQQYLLNVQDRKTEEDYFCAQVFLKASKWVEDNADNKPFFLWIDSFDPHEPWDPPREYADEYYRNDKVKEFIFPKNYPGITEEEKERTKALYYGEVTLVDKYVGIFLERVKDMGLLKDTIIALTSDHGTELWDVNRFGKSSAHLHAFNSQLNLYIRHPNPKFRGKEVSQFVQNHDFAPTLLNLLGVKHPPMDGQDIWPLVTGERKSVRDYLIDAWGPCVLVRDRTWSYMTNYTSGGGIISVLQSLQPGESLLFNLDDDPKETTNLSGKYPEVEKMMVERLVDLLGCKLPYDPLEKTTSSPPPIVSFIKARFGRQSS